MIILKRTSRKVERYRGTVLVETAIVTLLTTNPFPDSYTASVTTAKEGP